MCLGVTCHLHFCQNDRGLLPATAETRVGTDEELESAQKVNSREENSSAAPAGTRTRNLSVMTPALYQQATSYPGYEFCQAGIIIVIAWSEEGVVFAWGLLEVGVGG